MTNKYFNLDPAQTNPDESVSETLDRPKLSKEEKQEISEESQNSEEDIYSDMMSDGKLMNFQILTIAMPVDRTSRFLEDDLIQELIQDVSRTITPRKSIKSNQKVTFTRLYIDLPKSDEQDAGAKTDKTEKNKEYGILSEMMGDVLKLDEFRQILSESFRAKGNINENDEILMRLLSNLKSSRKDRENQIKDLQQQASFIEECRNSGALPLPLLKKLKFQSLVLDNYQMNEQVAQAFGKSIHYLGSAITSITLSNNDMKDQAVAYILEGMLPNAISTLFLS